jgi:tetratricopeptide (TPR) repeat protein
MPVNLLNRPPTVPPASRGGAAVTLAGRVWRVGLALLCGAQLLPAADLQLAQKEFISGNYTNAVRLAEQAIGANDSDEDWRLLLANTLMTLGRCTNAQAVITTNLARYNTSIRLRLLGYEVFRQNGQTNRAREALDEINQLVGNRSWAYRDAPNLLTLGRSALLFGADPKLVLEKLFDPAKKIDPGNRDVYLATGELALGKHDFELAAKLFQEGLKKFPDDPDLLFGVAKSYATSEREVMLRTLDRALKFNPNHVPSLLLIADHLVDAEEYAASEKMLQRALAVNPAHPEAWAYRAILAHLRSDAGAEKSARASALQSWAGNPAVDHLIGKKLSQKYRFAEGAAAQRQALRFDPAFLPAKSQLAQDLLRLGEEAESWLLADEVYRDDGYDVTAFNQVTLKDSMAKFQTLTNAHFILRMSAAEAAIYGAKVLALLGRARTVLCAKYGIELTRPTIVEIFPEQKDFAVRTFGMPGGAGYLGVCFGSVITANSPASQAAHPANWEAVLWHEFCHVVTLSLTKNKMPRWLSEGISVYEERLANPVWGQRMTPRYREMILGQELTPVGDLSAAFLAPKSDMHLQFAYYESSLAVEFLVQQFGADKLKAILGDLARGVEINQAITTHTAPLARIETDFAAFAKDRATKLAPGLDFEKPKPAGPGTARAPVPPGIELVEPKARDANLLSSNGTSTADWIKKSPTNFYALGQQARQLIQAKKWAEAKAPLQKLIELYPGHVEPGNAYQQLAGIHRELKEAEAERAVLTKFTALDAEATDAFLRLMELSAAVKDWAAVAQNAERFLAVNPLLAAPHQQLARASEELGRTKPAIDEYQTLLLLDPADPADVHFRLGRLLHQSGDAAAKRHVLQALEEAPRFREAHKLLLEIEAKSPKPPKSAAANGVKQP